MLCVVLISAVVVTLAMGTIETARRIISTPPGGAELGDARNWVKSPQKSRGGDSHSAT